MAVLSGQSVRVLYTTVALYGIHGFINMFRSRPPPPLAETGCVAWGNILASRGGKRENYSPRARFPVGSWSAR